MGTLTHELHDEIADPLWCIFHCTKHPRWLNTAKHAYPSQLSRTVQLEVFQNRLRIGRWTGLSFCVGLETRKCVCVWGGGGSRRGERTSDLSKKSLLATAPTSRELQSDRCAKAALGVLCSPCGKVNDCGLSSCSHAVDVFGANQKTNKNHCSKSNIWRARSRLYRS